MYNRKCLIFYSEEERLQLEEKFAVLMRSCHDE